MTNHTPAPWFLGVPFRYDDSVAEWCNVYADGEANHVAEVLVYDGKKNYHNAELIAAAPEVYGALERLVCGINTIIKTKGFDNLPPLLVLAKKDGEEALKKARGENEN